MVHEPEQRAEPRRRSLSPVQVAEYLRNHPDFLVKHPDLLSVLTPPSRRSGDTVVDMQQFMVERQRREIERLRAAYQELVAISRGTLSSQGRIHAAVLSLLAARSFEHLIDIITHELSHTLGCDAVTLCVEGDGHTLPRAIRAGLFVLRPGEIDLLLGPSNDVLVRPAPQHGLDIVFGPAAGLIRSDALMRLRISRAAPLGLLAIGARRDDYFAPHQGTELLAFLARAIEHSIRVWLDLPHDAR